MTDEYIAYDNHDGWARWNFDTLTETFITLHLPFYFQDAPQHIKTQLIEWCRHTANGMKERIPEEVKAYRDSPDIKRLRGKITVKQVSLEEF